MNALCASVPYFFFVHFKSNKTETIQPTRIPDIHCRRIKIYEKRSVNKAINKLALWAKKVPEYLYIQHVCVWSLRVCDWFESRLMRQRHIRDVYHINKYILYASSSESFIRVVVSFFLFISIVDCYTPIYRMRSLIVVMYAWHCGQFSQLVVGFKYYWFCDSLRSYVLRKAYYGILLQLMLN